MKIGNIVTKSNVFLAPMAGVSDAGFRAIASKFSAGLTTTEMVSVKALLHGNPATKKLLFSLPEESPRAVQLFGHVPEEFSAVITSGVLDDFDIIDLNFGCPMKKIISNGDGSALLDKPEIAGDIIRACKSATLKPITAKFRIGIDNEHINAVEFAKMLEKAGVDAICVHGRTQNQLYSGSVSYDVIRQVKENVSVPVVGNGDVTDLESLKKMLATGVDGVSVGRGAEGKPWIFSELIGKSPVVDIKHEVLFHVDTLRKIYPDRTVNLLMRKHFLWYLKGVNNAVDLKRKIVLASSLPQALSIFLNADL